MVAYRYKSVMTTPQMVDNMIIVVIGPLAPNLF